MKLYYIIIVIKLFYMVTNENENNRGLHDS